MDRDEMERALKIPLASGLQLEGVLHQPEGSPRAGVVLCHGMLSHKDSPKHVALARGLCERGIAALRFDFQGRGRSPGDLLGLTFSRQVVEARAAIEVLLRETGVGRLGLSGSSMGGAVAILIAGDAPLQLAGLVSLAAVGHTDRLAERIAGPKGMAAWERKGRLRLGEEPVGWSLVEDGRRVDVVGAAARVTCPWLILHGELDDVVPVDDAVALQRASGGRAALEIMAGADHQFSASEHQARAVARAVAFLTRALADNAP